MKQLLLATALIAIPVAVFTGYSLFTAPAPAQDQGASLGDLSPLRTIIADVETIAKTGDLGKAEHRITDFETAWDDAEGTMRKLNATSWGNVDEAADAALGALRAASPDASEVDTTLAALMAELDNPDIAPGGAAASAPIAIEGVEVTDANGHPLPCEEMLATVSAALTTSKLPEGDKTRASDLQAKALERCNADDDQRADAFSAQALAILVPAP